MGSKLKSVLITGANRGIGYHLLKTMLVQLKPEIVFATFRETAKSKAQEVKATKALHELASANKNIRLIQLDIGDHQKHFEVAEVVESVTKGTGLNLLINNAGVSSKFSKLNGVTYEDLKKNLDINFIAPLLLTKALAPHLEKASRNSGSAPCGIGRAAIVNISSILASIGGNDSGGMYPYRCSKAAVNAATKSMSLDFKKSQVIAVALHPGWVKTDMGGPKAPLSPEESVEGIVKLLETLNESHNGQFLQYDGKQLAW